MIKKHRGRPRIDEQLHFLNIRVTNKQKQLLEEERKRTLVPVCAIIRLALDKHFQMNEPKDPDWEPKDPDWERER